MSHANGDHRLGPFVVEERIGRGGMAVVHRGRHVRYDVSVAVKLMTAGHARHGRYHRAFLTEVESAARLHHPNIVTLLDYGVVPDELARAGGFVAGAPYIVMELVDGEPLDQVRITDYATLQRFLLQLLDALAHAHALGIIHRDLKPGNVLVEPDRRTLKLTDFGIAKTYGFEAPDGAQSDDKITGTPRYMAPEQIRGEWRAQGPWTDLYSLGIMAWRFVCGVPPYDGETTRILSGHLHEPLPAYTPTFPVPVRLREWLGGMLGKMPSDRFQRAADAADSLLQLGFPPVEEDDAPPTLRLDPSELPTLATLTDVTWLSDNPGDPNAESPSPSPSVQPAAVPERREIVDHRPKFRPDWRRAEERRDRLEIADAGLGLFGLRTPPFVDRLPQRDRLWSSLQHVTESAGPRGVVLRGPPGTGKTRLAAWLARRADELGSATVLKASHSPAGGLSEGIRPMLARHLRTWGLERAETFQRIEGVYRRLEYRDDVRALDALAMTELVSAVHRGDEQPEERTVQFLRPDERHLAIWRLFAALARDRPIVLWVEDAQWANDVLYFVRFMLQSTIKLPVLIVMTVSEAEGREMPPILTRLLADEAFEELSVGPLDDGDQAELVRSALPLTEPLADQVVRLSEGVPLFALQLIGDWVANDLLVPGPDGFQLVDSNTPLPEDLYSLWRQRIERLLDDASEREAAADALSMAAALGPSIDDSEWLQLVRDAHVAGALRDTFCGLGFAVRTETGWRFTQGFLHQSAVRLARETGRWVEANHRCAHAFDSEGSQGRRAIHLLAAGDREASLEPFVCAAEHALRASEQGRAARFSAWAEEVRQSLGLDESDRRAARLLFIRARLAAQERDYERSRRLNRRVLDAADEHGWSALEGRANLARGHDFLEIGDTSQALKMYERAYQHYLDVEDEAGMARALEDRGYTLLHVGETRRGIEYSAEARDLYRRLQDWKGVAYCAFHLGMGARLLGDLEDARVHYEEARQIAQQYGYRDAAADAMNALGDLDRVAGNLQGAESLYTEARNLWEALGTHKLETADFNLGLVAMARSDYQTARQKIEPLLKRYDELEIFMSLNITFHLMLPVYAHFGETGRYDEAVRRIEALNEDYLIVDPDLAMCAETAMRIWSPSDERRARMALEVAVRQWEELGDDERANRVRQSGASAASD